MISDNRTSSFELSNVFSLFKMQLSLNFKIAFIFFISYVCQLIMTCISFNTTDIIEGLFFTIANLMVCLILFIFYKDNPNWPLHFVMYSVYYVVYIFKAIIQYATGLNSFYSFITIKTTISFEGYVSTLLIVTLGHILLTIILLILSRITSFDIKSIKNTTINTNPFTIYIINALIFLWIIFSSAVMFKYGIAVMGTDNISLPYKLSGVFFYSRTVLIPLYYLYLLDQSIITGNRKLFFHVLFLFTILSISEIIIRATKSPLFIQILQISFLYMLHIANKTKLFFHIKIKYILLCFLFALLLWPLIEIYRAQMVSDSLTIELAADISDHTDNQNILIYSIERLFQRFVGFLQLSGIVTDQNIRHDFNTVLEYGSISIYYTKYYLGYDFEGHLSSPSLLGALLILGGLHGWWLLFIIYFIYINLLWGISSFYSYLKNPVRCFIVFRVVNDLMAGTVDNSIKYLFIVFAAAIGIEYLFLIVHVKKLEINFN